MIIKSKYSEVDTVSKVITIKCKCHFSDFWRELMRKYLRVHRDCQFPLISKNGVDTNMLREGYSMIGSHLIMKDSDGSGIDRSVLINERKKKLDKINDL